MFRMLQWLEWCSYKFKVIRHIIPFFPAVRFSVTVVLFLWCDYRMQCDLYLDLGSEVFWGVWGAGGGILFSVCCWAMFIQHISVSRSWRGRSQNWSTCAFGANTGIIYSIPSIFCADDI